MTERDVLLYWGHMTSRGNWVGEVAGTSSERVPKAHLLV